MSHFALYRKYRPKTFADFVNQESVTSVIKGALISQKISHAYLFSGPKGVGKTGLARILAKAANCLNIQKKYEPCNNCDACKTIDAGHSLDVLEIDAASHRGIDEIRDIIDKIQLAPAQNRYKIFIIDEVHMLTREAFNALLKTLEEPPPFVIFIMATTELYKVPPTIISRSQSFTFKRIQDEHIIKYLQKISLTEKFLIEKEALQLIARNSEGSLRDAIGILDQAVSLASENIKIDDIKFILGISKNTIIYELFDLLAQSSSKEFITKLNELMNSGLDLKQLTKNIIEFAHKILLVKMGQNLDNIAVDNEEAQILKKMAENFNTNTLLLIIRAFFDAEKDLKQADFPLIPLELAVLKIIPENNYELDPVKSKQNAPIKQIPLKKIQLPKNDPKAADDNFDSQNQIEFILNHWNELINWSKKQNHSIATLLSDSIPTKIQQGVLQLVVKFKFHEDLLNEVKTKLIIEQKLNKMFSGIISFTPQVLSDENRKDYLKNKKILNNIENTKGKELIDNVKEVFGV